MQNYRRSLSFLTWISPDYSQGRRKVRAQSPRQLGRRSRGGCAPGFSKRRGRGSLGAPGPDVPGLGEGLSVEVCPEQSDGGGYLCSGGAHSLEGQG